ncbi:leucine-rich repeat domain-containing protein [Aquiflexum sp. TKW24L]|uniref:COR domain-containing protein n=1 Tax=Aquiflexum sp. TKW24L TaxID=2942212 RepID=UPI0020BE6C6F|nr:COR domain-containing protein [Aquiflexum sp. TKW24L]MCL6257478.1 leucine-rich repeat domain-containing protein [Aquiflexum sp. TKW24L]
MDSLALTLIKKNMETKDPYLDLGNCGLSGDEPELELLRECEHLETLVMANDWNEYNEDIGDWIRVISQNSGKKNYFNKKNGIFNIEDYLPINLKEFILSNSSLDSFSLNGHPKNLEKLNLEFCRIYNFGSLKNLVFLRELNLAELEIDLPEITNCPNIEILNLNGNYIYNFEPISIFSKLKKLFLINNDARDLNFIKSLFNIEVLDLRGNKVKEIELLSNLKSLKILYISDNPEVRNISSFSKLVNIQKLVFSTSRISDLSGLKELIQNPNLKEVFLSNISPENNLNIPPEFFSQSENDNCLERLQSYFSSIEKGKSLTHEVPVILIGNSTAGKTSLMNFLCYDIFPPIENCSTHGVMPLVWEPENIEIKFNDFDLKDKKFQFYFWDFGGQEYYHATHRLFFKKSAIYILVWEHKTNFQGVLDQKINLKNKIGKIIEKKLPVNFFPVRYWLHSLRLIADDLERAPLLLIQNKIDEEENSQIYYLSNGEMTEFGIKKQFSFSVQDAFLSSSASINYLVYQLFKKEFINLAKLRVNNFNRQNKWGELIEIIKLRKDENILSMDTFFKIILSLNPDSIKEHILSYLISLKSLGYILHYSQNEFMKDFIFINPEWVVTKIYEILDSSVLKAGGVFNLDKVIEVVGEKVSYAFVSLILDFELIFEDKENQCFIAPQYLPELPKNEMALKWAMNSLPEEASIMIGFSEFMLPNIIQRVIAAIGDKAVDKIYWKYGGVFRVEGNPVLIQSFPDEKMVKIFVNKHDRASKWEIFRLFWEKAENDKSLMLSIDNGEEFVSIKDIFEQRDLKNKFIKSQKGNKVIIENYLYLFKNEPPIKSGSAMDEKKQIKIFVSYSSKDRELMELLRDGLKAHLSQHPKYQFQLWSDTEIDIGSNWKENIEAAMENSQASILLVSANFAASEFINKEELTIFFKKKKEEGFKFIPVMARNYQFENFESLSSLQFFKTYYSDYGYKKPIVKNKLMPFDKLAESEDTTDGQLNEYYHNLAIKILSIF